MKENNKLADAIDTYRTVIDTSGSSSGTRSSDQHEKKYVKFL